MPSGYDVVLTGFSLVIAVALAGSGLSLAVLVGGRAAAWAGGASMWKGALRVTLWGAAAMALSALVGSFFGVKVE